MPVADFKGLLSGSNEMERQRSFLRVEAMSRGVLLPGGAQDRRLAVPAYARLSTGLILPEGVRLEKRPTPIDYVSVHLSLDDYLEPSEMPGGSSEAVAEQIIASQDSRTLLVQLAYLNHVSTTSEGSGWLATGYRNELRPDLRPGFNAALGRGEEDTEVVFFSQQAALAAIRAVLEARPWPEEGLEQPSFATAVLLVHAVSGSLSEFEDGPRQIGDMPANLVMEMVRNGMFNEADDPYSVLGRTLRYWREHVVRVKRTELRQKPHELLEEALGVGFDEFFTLGLWLWGRARMRGIADPQKPMTMATSLPGVALTRERVEAFLDEVSAPPSWYRKGFEGRSSQYDFLPFQARPILRLGEELLVLDETFLLQKFTLTGLFWTVHDNERDNHSDLDRSRWTQAHGEAVEAMVEERLREMAPSLAGEGRGKSFYTEEELKQAYPGRKAADAVVDYGDRVLVFEVVSGQPVVGTRVAGAPESFERDTERLVLKKARQLDGTCRSLLADQEALTGCDPPPDRRIVPVVVVAGGYPGDALSRGHVGDL
jgi:hypothetical protein